MKSWGLDSRQSWQVMVATFLIRVMSLGIVECGSLFILATKSAFDTTREQASWPYTVAFCVRNGVGPLIGYIGYKIGIRNAVLLGCIITSIAMGGCFFAEKLMAITILWGFLLGVGLSFGTLPLNAIIIEHFNKQLTKATAIAYTGIQMGSMLFAPLIQYLIKCFGLFGTFLLLSGVMLNSIPAALYIILNKPGEKHKGTASKEQVRIKKLSHIVKKFGNRRSLQIFSSKNFKNDRIKHQDKFTTKSSVSTISIEPTVECHSCENTVNIILSKEVDNNDSSISSGFTISEVQNKRQPYQNNNIVCTTTKIECESKNKIVQDSMNFQVNVSSDKPPKTRPLVIRLFIHPIYLLLLVSGGVYFFALLAFISILADYAIDIGINKSNLQYVVMFNSASEIIGGFVLGSIMNSKCMSYSYNRFAALCFICQSLSMMSMVWNKNCVIFGFLIIVNQFASSGITFNYSSIIKESIDKELQSVAVASMFALSAPLILCISPLIGYFRDNNGSYDGVFYTLGATQMFTALLHLVIPIMYKHFKKNRENKGKQCHIR